MTILENWFQSVSETCSHHTYIDVRDWWRLVEISAPPLKVGKIFGDYSETRWFSDQESTCQTHRWAFAYGEI